MHPHAHSSPIENYAMIQPKLFVYDAIYNPRETQLLKEARLRGAETSNGLDMLLYQGALLNNGQDKNACISRKT